MGILNVFTHMGLIGVILYTLVFIVASFRAISRGKSPEVRIIGLWVAFRWILSWFEEFTMFDINQITIWLCVAICLSPTFHEMDSGQFRDFIRGLFFRFRWHEDVSHRSITD